MIANRARPVARLVAEPEANARDASGNPRTILDWLEQNPLPACAQRTAAETDADIPEERRGWD